eukprot:jgi/Mesen1/9447/ME000626S08698
MEWLTRRHFDLRGHAQCGAFHPTQPLLAVAVGKHIIEFDTLTGCKQSMVDIGGRVMRMSYSPSWSHVIVAVLEDLTIRSWDLESEHTAILYSPTDKKADKPVEVHIALTPLRQWLFFAAHRRSIVNVVGTVEGVRAATKIKTDVKKPITGLACHPRQPLLYIAYADGTIRAHNTQSFAVVYALGLDDPTVKLQGAGAIAFHNKEEILFVGDRSGALLAWDISAPTRLDLLGFDFGAEEESAQRVANMSREGRKKLLAVLQSARTEPGSIPKEKLAVLGTAGILSDQQIQQQLILGRGQSKITQATIADSVRKTFLYGSTQKNMQAATSNSGPVESVPLLSLTDPVDPLSDLPLCSGIYNYPSRVVMMDGCNLRAFNLSNGSVSLLKKFNPMSVDGGERRPRHLVHSAKQNAFLVFFKSGGGRGEAVVYRYLDVQEPIGEGMDTMAGLTGKDGTFTGTYDTQYAILDDDGYGLTLYALENPQEPEVGPDGGTSSTTAANGAGQEQRADDPLVESGVRRAPLDESTFVASAAMDFDRYAQQQEDEDSDANSVEDGEGARGGGGGRRGGGGGGGDRKGGGVTPFLFETPVQRIFGTPLGKPTHVRRAGACRRRAWLGAEGHSLSSFAVAAYPGSPRRSPLTKGAPFCCSVVGAWGDARQTSLLYAVTGSHLGLVQAYTDASGRPGGDLTESGGVAVLSTKPQEGKHVKLLALESVLQVRWQDKPAGAVAGVLTTHRVLLMSIRMEVLASTTAPLDLAYPTISSLHLPFPLGLAPLKLLDPTPA